jgi:hypothetical protein
MWGGLIQVTVPPNLAHVRALQHCDSASISDVTVHQHNHCHAIEDGEQTRRLRWTAACRVAFGEGGALRVAVSSGGV